MVAALSTSALHRSFEGMCACCQNTHKLIRIFRIKRPQSKYERSVLRSSSQPHFAYGVSGIDWDVTMGGGRDAHALYIRQAAPLLSLALRSILTVVKPPHPPPFHVECLGVTTASVMPIVSGSISSSRISRTLKVQCIDLGAGIRPGDCS
jgi:hypothetical protein